MSLLSSILHGYQHLFTEFFQVFFSVFFSAIFAHFLNLHFQTCRIWPVCFAIKQKKVSSVCLFPDLRSKMTFSWLILLHQNMMPSSGAIAKVKNLFVCFFADHAFSNKIWTLLRNQFYKNMAGRFQAFFFLISLAEQVDALATRASLSGLTQWTGE